jgi:hypothetical protein
MFSDLRRTFGMIRVRETETHIVVDGLPADLIARDIQRIWNTGKVNQWLFSNMGKSSFSFPRFFGPDVLYALQEIADDRYHRATRSELNKVIELLKAETWMRSIYTEHSDPLNLSKLSELNVSLLAHQRQFLEEYNYNVPRYDLNGYVLAAAPGAGKTIACVAIASCYEADLVIILSPKHAVYKVWVDTLQTRMAEPAKFWVAADEKPLTINSRYFIYHYEALAKAFDLVRAKPYTKIAILVDESHNFNEMVSLRTQLLVDLCNQTRCKCVVWSSGTPFKALGAEAIPIMRTLANDFTPDVEERFKKIYGKNATRANDILRNRMGFMTYRVTKEQVIPGTVIVRDIKVQIPNSKVYWLQNIKMEMEDFMVTQLSHYTSNMSAYDKRYEECLKIHRDSLVTKDQIRAYDLYRSYVADIRKYYDPLTMKVESMYCNKYELQVITPSLPPELRPVFRDIRSIIKYVYLKVLGEALGRVLGKRRSQCNIDMVNHSGLEAIVADSLKKTVIFTSYVGVVDAINKYLVERKFKPLLVYGDTNKNVTGIVTAFEKNIEDNPLIATYQSFSTAVPLIVANTVIIMDSPFRDYQLQQAIARVHRLGQDSQVYQFNMLLDTGLEPNISTRSQDILQWSAASVASIMGDSAPTNLGAILERDVTSVESFCDEMEGYDLLLH